VLEDPPGERKKSDFLIPEFPSRSLVTCLCRGVSSRRNCAIAPSVEYGGGQVAGTWGRKEGNGDEKNIVADQSRDSEKMTSNCEQGKKRGKEEVILRHAGRKESVSIEGSMKRGRRGSKRFRSTQEERFGRCSTFYLLRGADTCRKGGKALTRRGMRQFPPQGRQCLLNKGKKKLGLNRGEKCVFVARAGGFC